VLPDADLPDRPANPTELDLTTVAAAQERLEARQQEQLNAIETMAESATADISSVIGRLGLSPLGGPEDEGTSDGASDGLSGVPEGIGGPFVPAVAAPGDLAQGNLLQGVAFERQVERARSRLDYAVALHNQLLDLPIRRPLQKPLYVTSPFGNRSDPFRRSKAFHSGMDLRAAKGVPVLATGPGEVVKAGWGGAYGWMVEIRHASGLRTRYAHMSSVAVSAGERVEPGDMVGRVGSSGRSTGPHLHYETRLGADAVNPQRFFRIGDAYAR
jgi:murein DD-endopeptidase MepM/ murein hydrolase activator NlpD